MEKNIMNEIVQGVLNVKDFGWLKKNFGNSKEVLEFIKFAKIWQPQDVKSLVRVAESFESLNREPSFVSACCFHATEARDGLVERLSPSLIDIVVETATTAINSKKVREWPIYTFGPGDSTFIDDLELKDILLPFMKTLNNSQLEILLSQQYTLTDQLAEKLRKKNFPVVLNSLTDLASKLSSKIDVRDLLAEAQVIRGKIMAEKFRNNEIPSPTIFQILSPQEQETRCSKEAVIYLLLTETHGCKSIYLGLEVHGGYWKAGDLNQFDGKFLPLCWPHSAIRQHWGDWTEKQKLELINNQRKFLERIRENF